MALAHRPSRCFVWFCAGTVLVLSYAIAPSSGLGPSGPQQALPNVMPYREIEYSPPVLNNNYRAPVRFDAKGMGNLYNFTKLFMRIIQREEPYPQGLVRVEDGRLEVGPVEWHSLVAYYGGLLGVVLVGLVLVAVLPVAGLMFCCCRCTGRCGARSQPFDKRHDPCRRHFFGVLLSAIAIALLFGVVCAFVTNEYMEKGVRELPNKTSIIIDDTRLFLQNTQKEINHLLIDNYKELSTALDKSLDSSGEKMNRQLAEISHATSLDNLTQLVAGLGNIKADLAEVSSITDQLKSSARILKKGLMRVKNSLIDISARCKRIAQCNGVINEYSQQIDQIAIKEQFDDMLDKYFPKLPNITESLQAVSGLVSEEVKRELTNGKRQLDNVQREIQRTVDNAIPTISTSIAKTGDDVGRIAREITKYLDNADQAVFRNTEVPLDQAKFYIQQFSPYRYDMDLSVSCMLLLILVPITLGLFCGFCGKRPDAAYNDDSCTKGSGARLLMIAVWLILLLSSFIIIIVLMHFALGVVAQRTVCEPLREPQYNQIFSLVDQVIPLEKILQVQVLDNHRRGRHRRMQPAHTSISSVIVACHQNRTIYDVLNLESRVNVSEVLTFANNRNLQEALDAIRDRLNVEGEIVILPDQAKRKLAELAESSPTIPFDTYTEVLGQKITELNFTDFANVLQTVASRIDDISIQDELKVEAKSLIHYQRDIEELAVFAHNLSEKVKELKDHLNINHNSLKDAIYGLMNEVIKAQDYLNKDGPQKLLEIAQQFADEFLSHVRHYMQRVVDHTHSEVGKCWPLSRVYNATLIATCDEILNPFNGFWASVGWCLLLFIPSIILSVKLATLYQKSDPYPGPLVEAEYMYDAYADRDNIPLANVHDKKRKKTKQSRGRNYQETYDNSSGGAGYLQDYSAHLGRAERDRARTDPERPGHSQGGQRYSDMAPKHWDFPNNGPPRYHSPHTSHTPPMSTEYERPPPYYFPGPGESRP
ncbi:prominin-like protein isoform X1 [Frankliniella occidentalis]|uniref:Prominin-like protein isoform X1 n=1 Tax=Frankliniella occidentalis TaxID=133901 RepID=A0A6J1SSW1_FRAOC|nr:prominin-like protein isoform X1 [Frankliniella occidentalis]